MLAGELRGRGFSSAGSARGARSACNPLFAFQLMNNFTLCHGAIRGGLGGPNGAFFSRGAGTVRALAEAVARWPRASASGPWREARTRRCTR